MSITIRIETSDDYGWLVYSNTGKCFGFVTKEDGPPEIIFPATQTIETIAVTREYFEQCYKRRFQRLR